MQAKRKRSFQIFCQEGFPRANPFPGWNQLMKGSEGAGLLGWTAHNDAMNCQHSAPGEDEDLLRIKLAHLELSIIH